MSGGTTPVSQTTTPNLSPNAQALSDLALPKLQQFAATNIKLPDQTVSPFTAAQTAGQQDVLNANPTQQGVVQGAASANNLLTSGSLLDPNSNPALRATIDASTRPITQALTENELPALRGNAVTTGNFGSSRQGIAEGLATGRASQAIGDTAAKIATTGYGQGLQALQQGVASAPQTAGAQVIPGVSTSGVGDVQQALQQAILSGANSKSTLEQLLPFLQGSALQGLASSIPSGSTTTGTVASPNTALQGAGLGIAGLGALGSLGGSAGLGGLAALFSDRRAKDDIQIVGRLFDGTAIYRFRYKGLVRVEIGVMSDEVAPECITKIGGLDFVDYGKATEKSVQMGEKNGS